MLTLTVLRCPAAVVPESRQADGGEIVIGRGQDCDWTLPDPERDLSKRHCVLAYRAGGWQVTDVSSNGTFLNREPVPIGSRTPRRLRQGDRLRLGAYEIEVGITAEQAVGPVRPARDPFADDPLASRPSWPADDPLFSIDQHSGHQHSGDHQPGEGQQGGPSAFSLPADFNPLASDEADNPFAGASRPDHTPAVGDAYRPPRPARSLLPDDWNLDLGPSGAGQPGPDHPSPLPPPSLPPIAPSTASDAADLMAAFLRGAGLPDARPAEPVATMEALGQAFRAFVTGLRNAMIARAAVKSEFRIEQTMVRVRGNNPLKFSAGDDDALSALLGAGRHVDMTPVKAVTEALQDIRLHELATVAAMRAAVQALIARLDPAALRQAAEAAGGLALVPAQRKARAWDAYEALYASTARALQDDFDAVFGMAFARAYEQALQDVARRKDWV